MEIRKITKEEILALKNKTQREAFYRDWESWTLVADVPQLNGMKVTMCQLPDGYRLSATVFNTGRILPKKTVHFQIIAPDWEYGPYFENSLGALIDKLTQLRQRIVKGSCDEPPQNRPVQLRAPAKAGRNICVHRWLFPPKILCVLPILRQRINPYGDQDKSN